MAWFQDYQLAVSSKSLDFAGPPRLVGLRATLVDGVMRELTPSE